ncbi:MAG: SHOCT domain-containing protein [Betaproteobacteria bacterium]|nr:SHOCT domain-containing protein [Betaproteobacteria bacterium]MDE2623388.1 SHOCT domain-containing protein [Betaproteobacteria bacterium]
MSMGLGMIGMGLFWVLAVLGLIALFRGAFSRERRGPEQKTALDLLKERYARGEIGKAEFEQIRRDLEG